MKPKFKDFILYCRNKGVGLAQSLVCESEVEYLDAVMCSGEVGEFVHDVTMIMSLLCSRYML